LDTLLANGTTTASVYSTQVANSADLFFAEADRRNMRMLTGKMLMDSPVNTDGDLRDRSVDDAVESSRKLAKKRHGTGRRLHSVNPRFVINCTGDMLAAAGKLYGEKIEDKLLPLWMHTHLSENKEEEELVTKNLFASIMGESVPGWAGASDTVRTYTALLTFLWVPDHDRVRAHAAPCLEFLALHSQKRSRWEWCAHYEGMAAGVGGRAHGDRVGGFGARRAGRGGTGRVGSSEGRGGARLFPVSAPLSGL
jgi:hypothetical protein